MTKVTMFVCDRSGRDTKKFEAEEIVNEIPQSHRSTRSPSGSPTARDCVNPAPASPGSFLGEIPLWCREALSPQDIEVMFQAIYEETPVPAEDFIDSVYAQFGRSGSLSEKQKKAIQKFYRNVMLKRERIQG